MAVSPAKIGLALSGQAVARASGETWVLLSSGAIPCGSERILNVLPRGRRGEQVPSCEQS
jgi:hypothetical protein